MDHHFQVVDILSDDLYNPEKKTQEFVITLYGINQDGERLVCHVKKYKPYFHLRAGNLSDDHTSLVEVMAFEANRLASMGSYKHVLCVLPTAFAFSQEEILQSLNSLIANRKAVYTTCIKKFESCPLTY